MSLQDRYGVRSVTDDAEAAIYRLLIWRSQQGEFGRNHFGRGPQVQRIGQLKWRIGDNRTGSPERILTNRQASAIARGAFTLDNVPKNEMLPNVWPTFTDPKIPYTAPAPIERKPVERVRRPWAKLQKRGPKR